MKGNSGIVSELVRFVREQRGINRELLRFRREQRGINRRLGQFVAAQHHLNIQSERRFRLFYREISSLKHAK